MSSKNNEVNLIVAIGKGGAIGRNGDLIWTIPADLKRFKALTTGHPVIMGRKTWETLPKKPLPGRRNIVITRQPDYKAEGAEVAGSLSRALEISEGESPFIIGGAQIYNASLPLVSTLYLTEIDRSCDDADTFLNIDFNSGDWVAEETGDWQTTPEGIPFRYITYKRKSL